MSLTNQSLVFNFVSSIYLPILTTEKQVEETENKDDIDQVQYLTENV